MIIQKSKNIPENDKCIICRNYINQNDINYNNYEVVVTKRSKTKKYAHTSCIRRKENTNEQMQEI